jgi:hypothetical protein
MMSKPCKPLPGRILEAMAGAGHSVTAGELLLVPIDQL